MGEQRTGAVRVLRNERQQMSGFQLLQALPYHSAKLTFFDPQYRAVMDNLSYGNEGARQKARANLRQQTDHEIALFVQEIERVLKPSGHLMMWTDKFSIGSGHHLSYFRFAPTLKIVDLIAWNSLRFGMGSRTRGATEYLVVAQKEPLRAKGVWGDQSIRDCWSESSDRDLHPHAKPFKLIETLIRATTGRGDLVVDPCAGSYIVLEACRVSGREFAGCDIA